MEKVYRILCDGIDGTATCGYTTSVSNLAIGLDSPYETHIFTPDQTICIDDGNYVQDMILTSGKLCFHKFQFTIPSYIEQARITKIEIVYKGDAGNDGIGGGQA